MGEQENSLKLGTLEDRIILLAGPRLVGKTEITNALLTGHPNEYVVALSATDRDKRPREERYQETHVYMKPEALTDAVRKGDIFFFYALNETGNYYGLLKSEIFGKSHRVAVQGVGAEVRAT